MSKIMHVQKEFNQNLSNLGYYSMHEDNLNSLEYQVENPLISHKFCIFPKISPTKEEIRLQFLNHFLFKQIFSKFHFEDSSKDTYSRFFRDEENYVHLGKVLLFENIGQVKKEEYEDENYKLELITPSIAHQRIKNSPQIPSITSLKTKTFPLERKIELLLCPTEEVARDLISLTTIDYLTPQDMDKYGLNLN